MTTTPRVVAVLVTFRRPRELAISLEMVRSQRLQPELVVVIDNAADRETAAVAAAFGDRACVRYVPASTNLGPAGGVAAALRLLLDGTDGVSPVNDDTWIALLDDDDPIPDEAVISELVAMGEEQRLHDQRVGAVGMVGARFDLRTGRGARVPDLELSGAVEVDWIGGGQVSMYHASALRDVGGPNPELFFGFDDLDLGLRLRAAGWRLLAHGPRWRAERSRHGRLGDEPPPLERSSAPWRRYYSVRNLVHILHSTGHTTAAVRATVRGAIAAPARAVIRGRGRGWEEVSLGLRGARDGWRGRLGRRVEPS